MEREHGRQRQGRARRRHHGPEHAERERQDGDRHARQGEDRIRVVGHQPHALLQRERARRQQRARHARIADRALQHGRRRQIRLGGRRHGQDSRLPVRRLVHGPERRKQIRFQHAAHRQRDRVRALGRQRVHRQIRRQRRDRRRHPGSGVPIQHRPEPAPERVHARRVHVHRVEARRQPAGVRRRPVGHEPDHAAERDRHHGRPMVGQRGPHPLQSEPARGQDRGRPGHPQLGWPHRRHADHRPERLDDRRVHVRRLGHQPGRERRQVRAGSQVDGERHAHPVRAVDARPGQPHLRRQRGDRRQDRPADWQDRREDQRARQRIHPRRLHVRHVEHSGRLQGQCSET